MNIEEEGCFLHVFLRRVIAIISLVKETFMTLIPKKEFNNFFNTDGCQLKQPVQVFSTMSFHYAF